MSKVGIFTLTVVAIYLVGRWHWCRRVEEMTKA